MVIKTRDSVNNFSGDQNMLLPACVKHGSLPEVCLCQTRVREIILPLVFCLFAPFFLIGFGSSFKEGVPIH